MNEVIKDKKVRIYTDGACKGNPGPGGYGALVFIENEKEEVVEEFSLSEGYEKTTNNRMELLAVIKALQATQLKLSQRGDSLLSYSITVTSDSRYLTDSVNKGWVYSWRRNGWRNSSGSTPNVDLWNDLVGLLDTYHVEFSWVRGHSGHPENELCDKLANKACLNVTSSDPTSYALHIL